jgi:hypothetical protein
VPLLKLSQNYVDSQNRATKQMQIHDALPGEVSAFLAAIAESVGRGGFVTRPFWVM